LDKGTDADAEDDKGFALLMGSSYDGDSKWVKLLLEHGAKINVNLAHLCKAAASRMIQKADPAYCSIPREPWLTYKGFNEFA
jgi:hypothetical protein